MIAMNESEAPLELAGVHLQPYNEVVRPGQIWKVSKYFLRRWTPYMPASHIWLIIGARQESYFNGNRPWFTAYDQNLASASGVHVRSFRRTAKKEIVESRGPLAYFIAKEGDPAYVTGQPTPRQEETRYQIRLDDPLTPADAEALVYWLRRHTPQKVTPESVRELLSVAREEAGRSFYAAEIDASVADHRLLTVADVVAHVFPDVAGSTSWREAADRLHTHIVEPHLCHLETQYLRHKWLAELGPGPLLLFVYLRNLCYHNAQTGETRDRVTIVSGELEALFQKSSVTLRAWFAQLNERLGESHPHGPFIEVLDSNKRSDQKVVTLYHLNLLTPLFPSDLDVYHQLLQDGMAVGAEGVAQELAATLQGGRENFVSHEPEGDVRNGSHVSEGSESNDSHADGGEQSFVSRLAKKWQPYKYYRALFDALGITDSTQIEEITQQQQHAWKVENGEALKSFAAAAVGSLEGLLDHFGIYGKTRTKILAGQLCLEEVMAWYLYAERESGLDYPERYMMKQAVEGQRPPEQFVQLVRLSWEQWRVFSVVRQTSTPHQMLEDLARLPSFVIWCDVYGHLPPEALPFRAGERIDTLVIEQEGAKGNVDAREAEGVGATDAVLSSSRVEDQCLWAEALQELSQQMTRATFDRWLNDAVFLRRDEDTFVIIVCNQAAREWLTHRMKTVVERTLSSIVGKGTKVKFIEKRT